jgi:predicted nucleic acid-binding protein
VIVLDASAMVELLLQTSLGSRVEAAGVSAEELHAPHLLDVEVFQVLRRLVASGELSASGRRWHSST